jgi:hypothetical protein
MRPCWWVSANRCVGCWVGKMPRSPGDGSAWQMVAKYAFLIALLVFILVHLYINFGL